MISVPLTIRTVAVLPGRPCRLCGTARRGPRVQAGGDLGLVHVRCFTAWDRAAEAFEATQAFGLARCA